MTHFGLIAGERRKPTAERPTGGYSALELMRLVEEWTAKDDAIDDAQADRLARFTLLLKGVGGLAIAPKPTFYLKVVKAIFNYGRSVGQGGGAK